MLTFPLFGWENCLRFVEQFIRTIFATYLVIYKLFILFFRTLERRKAATWLSC